MESKLCNICPRECNALRDETRGEGYCRSPLLPKIARYAPHFFEEPCISGKNGSGTVFFSGCNLRCEYCQNHEISSGEKGKIFTPDGLKNIYSELMKLGVHNINLVTPTHYADIIARSLDEKLSVPVVYNTSGYEKTETLKKLRGKIDIYLTDFKYGLDEIAKKYSSCDNYVAVAKKALDEMYSQCGDFVIDENGIMQKGVIVRHLVLPDEIENTVEVIDYIDTRFRGKKILFSLMSQYTPVVFSEKHKNLNRSISKEEYKRVTDYLEFTDIKYGYIQELSSSDKAYIPDFNL